MAYIGTTFEILRAKLGPDPRVNPGLLGLYALLVHTTGIDTTRENVHDAWALWRRRTVPDHPDLVPFEQLAEESAEHYRQYRDLIRHVAAERDHHGGW